MLKKNVKITVLLIACIITMLSGTCVKTNAMELAAYELLPVVQGAYSAAMSQQYYEQLTDKQRDNFELLMGINSAQYYGLSGVTLNIDEATNLVGSTAIEKATNWLKKLGRNTFLSAMSGVGIGSEQANKYLNIVSTALDVAVKQEYSGNNDSLVTRLINNIGVAGSIPFGFQATRNAIKSTGASIGGNSVSSVSGISQTVNANSKTYQNKEITYATNLSATFQNVTFLTDSSNYSSNKYLVSNHELALFINTNNLTIRIVDVTTGGVVNNSNVGSAFKGTFVPETTYKGGVYFIGTYAGNGSGYPTSIPLSSTSSVEGIRSWLSTQTVKPSFYGMSNRDTTNIFGSSTWNTFYLVNFDVYVGASWDVAQPIQNIDDLGLVGTSGQAIDTPDDEDYVINLDSVISGIADKISALEQGLTQTKSLEDVIKESITTYEGQLIDSYTKVIQEAINSGNNSGVVLPNNLFQGIEKYVHYLWQETKPLVKFTKSLFDALTWQNENGDYGMSWIVYGIITLGLGGGIVSKFLQ